MGNSPASPPGVGKDFNQHPGTGAGGTQDELNPFEPGSIESRAQAESLGDASAAIGFEPKVDFLQLVREAEQQSNLYLAQVNRKAWTQSYRAFHQEHFVGSKYTRPDWRNRSKFFRPKTRSAVRKDMAAVAASMFGSVTAIQCLPGNEGDQRQRAAAAVMQELVNYRTDRTSGKASIPWFPICMGAREDSLMTGICLSKQSWKLELRRLGTQKEMVEGEDGVYGEVEHEVWSPDIDRPDCQLIPPENFIIDPSANWVEPEQSAQYIIIKWPMQVEEVKEKMRSPVSPWKEVDDAILRTAGAASEVTVTAIRRAREMGLDRLDETQTGTHFQIVWVYEVYMRFGGEDWTFYSISDRAYLTDPKPVREVYPEQAGQRPLILGIASLEAHRLFPMSPVESWQMLQLELNDLANLSLDAIKQNVMPVSKVVRGRAIDLDQVKRRAHGSSILVQNKDDVTWDRPPDIPQSVPMMSRELELEMDDLAGQFNGQTAENSNSLSRTLGGLKLVAGTANAVQEYDIRIWIETWVERVLMQIMHLEQYYESDPIVLGLVGERAQMFQKHGIDQIDDKLLEENVTLRVSAGLGAGDPQQRLQKFAQAASLAFPILQHAPQFQSGELQIDPEAVMEEIFGAAGYRDGGTRFIKKGPPQPNPMANLQQQEVLSKIEKNKKTASSSLMMGLAAMAKVSLGNKELEADKADSLTDSIFQAHQMGHEHGHKHNEMHLSALDHGQRHGLGIAQHRLATDKQDLARDQQGYEQAGADREHQLARDQHDLEVSKHEHEKVMGKQEAKEKK